jgi:glycosyltransferase involved in cell wall biosynthesis
MTITLLLLRSIWALKRFAYRPLPGDHSDQPLPTVSVCVAARNETHALARCLERIIKSDYEKLEILVLDDSSTDDTSLIIKSFANAGVRFIPGKPLPQGWLGKNHAYHTLLEEASGELALFIDVDTMIEPSTISQLVSQLRSHQRDMLSILPRRDDGVRASAVLGTMRYYWELLLTTSVRPPASSALWLVNKDSLEQLQVGMADYGMSVRPERHFARLFQQKKAYYYLIGSKRLGVSYEKHLHSQYETAIRLYYPMSGRSLIGLVGWMLFLVTLVAPLAVFAIGETLPLRYWSAGLIVLIAATFGLFVWHTYDRRSWPIRILLGPLLALQELVLLIVSFWSYRRGKVEWKGRRVLAQPARSDSLRLED